MRTTRLVLAALVAGVGLVLGIPGPAAACSCVSASTEEFVGYADVIVTGTLIDAQDPPQQRIMSSSDPITYTVAVERVFQGEASEKVEFTSAMSGASCGLARMAVDRRYTFFLDTEGEALTASLCGGTAPARPALERRVVRSTGPPTVPVGTASDPSTTGTVAAAPEDTPAPSTPARWPWPVAGAGVVALAALTWLGVHRSRRSSKPR